MVITGFDMLCMVSPGQRHLDAADTGAGKCSATARCRPHKVPHVASPRVPLLIIILACGMSPRTAGTSSISLSNTGTESLSAQGKPQAQPDRANSAASQFIFARTTAPKCSTADEKCRCPASGLIVSPLTTAYGAIASTGNAA